MIKFITDGHYGDKELIGKTIDESYCVFNGKGFTILGQHLRKLTKTPWTDDFEYVFTNEEFEHIVEGMNPEAFAKLFGRYAVVVNCGYIRCSECIIGGENCSELLKISQKVYERVKEREQKTTNA